MIAVYHLNTGLSLADEHALAEAIATARDLAWAAAPAHADVFVLTGPIAPLIRPALLHVWEDWIDGRAPLVAAGRASIDGHPFGRGGIAEIPQLQAAIKVDGEPPTAAAIQAGIRQALQSLPERR